MQTITQFRKKNNIAKTTTVENWIDNNLIPGVVIKDGQYLLPDMARRPYKNRWLNASTRADKIYTHIVIACLKRRHISPIIFYMEPSEFNHYVTQLMNANVISSCCDEGITYYDATPSAKEWTNRTSREITRLIISSISEGITRAYI